MRPNNSLTFVYTRSLFTSQKEPEALHDREFLGELGMLAHVMSGKNSHSKIKTVSMKKFSQMSSI